MAELLDFDPETGIAHYFSHDEMTNLSTIQTVQDVEPLLKYTQALRNDSGTDQGIKQGFWLYAKIPAVVQVAMRHKGIDINDPDATKRIIEEINTHYSHLKCTQKSEGGKLKQLYLPNAD
jgi:hypothetical protein